MTEKQRPHAGKMTRAAGLVGVLTLASRILGLLRDGVVAARFGRGLTDAFFVAFTIPNVLRRLLAEGSLTVAFIPVYTDYLHNRGPTEARELLRATLGASLVALVLVTGLGILFAPQLVWLFAEGLAGSERLPLAIMLTRLMFPFLITVGLMALAMGVLNTHGHFAAPAAAPVLLNVAMIAGALWGGRPMLSQGWPAITALALGVLSGGLLQLGAQAPPLAKIDALVLPRLALGDPGVRRIARLMGPSLFGLAIYQVTIILSRRFASYLAVGAVSYLYYAQRLIEFPLGIFAAAVATVSMPNLSAQATSGRIDELKATFRYTLGIVSFVMIPATAGLVALAQPLVAVLFQRGAFDLQMSQQTAITLIGFATGLVAGGGVRQTAPVFFALEDTKTPVVASAVGLAVYALAAWLSYRPLGTLGLALSVALSSTANFAFLLVALRRKLGPLGLAALLRSVGKSSFAAGLAGVAAWGAAGWGDFSVGGALVRNYLALGGAVLAGIAVYLGAARIVGSAELEAFSAAFARRRNNRK